jgi:hypothetical protein
VKRGKNMVQKMKKVVSALLVMAMVLSSLSLPIQASAKAAYATRGKVIAQVVKATGAKKTASAKQMKAVKDVKKSSSNYKAVSKALKVGIITPDAKGKVYPEKTATYEYAAALLAKATGKTTEEILGSTKASKKITVKQLKKLIRKSIVTEDDPYIDDPYIDDPYIDDPYDDDSSDNREPLTSFTLPENANADEAAALEALINEQRSRGAYLTGDLRNTEDIPEDDREFGLEYGWDKEGHLVSITWSDLGLSGDISFAGLPYLQKLEVYSNEITSIDLSKNTVLSVFNCQVNHSLENLDLSNNTELTELYCRSSGLRDLDVSNNTKLKILYCGDSDAPFSVNIRNNTELEKFYCFGCTLGELDTSNNPRLTYLNCSYTGLSDLDVSKNTELQFLYCVGNSISRLDLTSNTKLEEVDCDESVTVIGYNGKFGSDNEW